ncbi:glycoside hydrolase family 3 N-terminal domain-containing protein [uncultured Bacteroides sp.]|uniref:glycoside hydrolase family 3 N-terminal domain-containing protein n=1 Tax=uncultured Bacteroides sp. TaxID=162156 RepID=UPI002AAC2ABA|nr:glycoside hydrolase family 3 N-terminal domain-containing protein [uncultured Bacteroides sp.]
MHKHFITVCCSLLVAFQLSAQPLYKNPNAPIKDRISNLLSLMTLNEKIGQLCCPLGWEMYTKTKKSVIASDLFITQMKNRPIGSFWAALRADPWTKKTLVTGLTPQQAAEAINALQKYAMKETRLGIPILFAEECAHGHMAIGTTVFPTSIGQASTWDDKLMEEMGKVIALECKSQGASIGYGPILDVAREPRWSRMEETFGEDPILTGIMGSAFVKGLQAKSQNGKTEFYSTLKHFAGYGIPLGGHNGGRTQISTRELFSDYLPPFKMAVKAGAKTIMSSYNSIDGIPCTANSFLLKDILRKEWGFNGFVFSDLGSIEGIYGSHHVAANIKEAAVMALQAGVDVDLGGNAYGKNLEKAIQEKLISEDELNSAVSNVLRLKFEAGLFENPYVSPAEAAKIVRCEKHKSLARQVARESIVLLKNDKTLPLNKSIKSIAVIGPNADNIYNQLGDYTAPQERTNIKTVLDGIKNIGSKETIINYAKGCAIRDTTQSDIASAVEAAKKSDAVVLVLGGSSARDFSTEYKETGAATVSDKKQVLSDMESGEGYDRSSLDLMGDQEKLLQAVARTGKPLIVIYIEGRPLNMNSSSEKANALLTAWYPGQEGGTAIAEVLFGDYNPAGRLPVSIPKSVGQLPVYYSLGEQNNYVESSSVPLYSFGYGLSYTTFEYSDLVIEPADKDSFKVSFKVKNNGNREGDEVAQLYLRDDVSSVATPDIQLKKFRRVHLDKGETKEIEFILQKEDLSLYNPKMEFVAEPGTFTVMIGPSSSNILLKGKFELK